jgi:hypothetical protein
LQYQVYDEPVQAKSRELERERQEEGVKRKDLKKGKP